MNLRLNLCENEFQCKYGRGFTLHHVSSDQYKALVNQRKSRPNKYKSVTVSDPQPSDSTNVQRAAPARLQSLDPLETAKEPQLDLASSARADSDLLMSCSFRKDKRLRPAALSADDDARKSGKGRCCNIRPQFFFKREILLILNNYIKIIQLYKIHSGLCITKIHIAYEKETKKRERHDLKIMAQQTTTSDFNLSASQTKATLGL